MGDAVTAARPQVDMRRIPMTKGDRALQTYHPPVPNHRPPPPLRAHLSRWGVVRFPTTEPGLDIQQTTMRDVLGIDPDTAADAAGVAEQLKAWRPEQSVYSYRYVKDLRQRVAASPAVLGAYENIIRTAVAPFVLSHCPAKLADPNHGTCCLLYQFPPTLRVFPSDGRPLGREHSDLEFGHQTGEINCWLPLTTTVEGNSLWVESAPGQDDFQPFPETVYGEMRMFNGVECRHKTVANCTGQTRISFDFRVACQCCFQRDYQLPNVTYRHVMRECHSLRPP